jgi:hypothetical protein
MTTAADLAAKKCVPCEGGVPKLTPAEASEMKPTIGTLSWSAMVV